MIRRWVKLALPLISSIAIHAAILGPAHYWLKVAPGQNESLQSRSYVSFGTIQVSMKSRRPGERQNSQTMKSRRQADLVRHEIQDPSVETAAPAGHEPQTGEPDHQGLSQETFNHYSQEIRARIESSLYYPIHLRRIGKQGSLVLKLVLDHQGQLQTSDVSPSSGSAELDQLALDAAQAAAPFPIPPIQEGPSKTLLIAIPIEFKVR